MTSKRKTVLTIAVVAAAASALVAFAVFSAFSSTTSNPNNSFAAGTVTLTGNNTASAFYNVSNAKPGDSSTEKCMKVTYTGSLGANVRLYRSTFTGGTGLDPYLTLTVTKGVGDATNCSDFVGATTVHSGSLQSLGTAFGTGTALTNTLANATWSTNDTVTYKVQASLASGVDPAANGLATGTHSVTWEAQNT